MSLLSQTGGWCQIIPHGIGALHTPKLQNTKYLEYSPHLFLHLPPSQLLGKKSGLQMKTLVGSGLPYADVRKIKHYEATSSTLCNHGAKARINFIFLPSVRMFIRSHFFSQYSFLPKQAKLCIVGRFLSDQAFICRKEWRTGKRWEVVGNPGRPMIKTG